MARIKGEVKMKLPTSQRLTDDHNALAALLADLKGSLAKSDVEVSYANLDLFWARLAVHIRAEHLHLFPAVIKQMSEAQSTVAALRDDHDFFMKQIARAIAVLRDLRQTNSNVLITEGLAKVQELIGAVEQRLVNHNEVEEAEIYRWAAEVLNHQQRLELAAEINRELANKPSRFTLSSWLNDAREIDE
jgi:hemerythrin superfamily protein